MRSGLTCATEHMRKVSSDIVFYGNCQAIGLCQVYQRFIRHETGLNPLFIDINTGSAREREKMRRASVVVFQIFDSAGWLKEADVHPHAKVVRVPLYNAGFLWPYGNQAHVRNEGGPHFVHGPYPPNIGDSYLNRMIQRGVPFEQVIDEYLALDIAKATHLTRLQEISIDRQRQRDKQTDISVADFIEERFREEQLFFTPDHPSLTMFAFVARQVFSCLGVNDGLVKEALASVYYSPFPQTEAPVHPGVASHFGLKWANEETLYRFWDEGTYTFKEFVSNYLNYRWNQDLARGILAKHLPVRERLEVIDRALMCSPTSLAGMLKKAECLLKLRRLREAEQCVRRAIAVHPLEFSALQLLAKVLATKGDLDAAVSAAERAVGLFPREATSSAVLAKVLVNGCRPEYAKECAMLAARLMPGDPRLLKRIARILLRLGSFRDAARWAARAYALQVGPLQKIAKRLGLALGRARSRLRLVEVAQEKAESASLYNRLGHILVQAGDVVGAENVFRCAAGIQLDMEELQEKVGPALRRQGRLEEAL